MHPIVGYGIAYLLWAVTIALSLFVAMMVRGTYQFTLVQNIVDRYSLRAVNQFATVFLALALVILVVFTEHFYRTAVEKDLLLPRFCLLSAIGLGILALNQTARLLVELSLGFASPATTILLLGAVAGTVTCLWLARSLR